MPRVVSADGMSSPHFPLRFNCAFCRKFTAQLLILCPDEAFSEDSDIGDINHGEEIPADTEPKTQLNGELHDDMEEAAQEGSLPARAESEDTDVSKPGDPEEEYVVEQIQGHRTRKGTVEYHIKWVGYDKSENTWEPEGHLLP